MVKLIFKDQEIGEYESFDDAFIALESLEYQHGANMDNETGGEHG